MYPLCDDARSDAFCALFLIAFRPQSSQRLRMAQILPESGWPWRIVTPSQMQQAAAALVVQTKTAPAQRPQRQLLPLARRRMLVRLRFWRMRMGAREPLPRLRRRLSPLTARTRHGALLRMASPPKWAIALSAR